MTTENIDPAVLLRRNNVTVSGTGTKPMLLAHGYGCDQNMWRYVTPAFGDDFKLVLYDLTGSGKSDLTAYEPSKYSTLHGHATDMLEICKALDLSDVTFVGHSVSSMSGVLAANREPGRFSAIIMIAPSPCYTNDGDYLGGFSRNDIDGLLDFLDTNFLGWSNQMAPAIMGVPEEPELAEELATSF
jgi:sigma-B regulation protein RsbQ